MPTEQQNNTTSAANQAAASATGGDNEKVTLTKAELKQLISDQVKEQMGATDAHTRVLKRVQERKVHLRMLNGRAVVAFKNQGTESRPQYVRRELDKSDPRGEKLYVTVILEDRGSGHEEVTVDYNEFIREATRIECPVKSTEEHEWVMNQGMVKARTTEEYSMVEENYEVPLDVIGRTSFFTVEIPAQETDDGEARVVQVHENYVNV